MNFEALKLKEEEKKKVELSEKEKKGQHEKVLDFQRNKEQVKVKIEADEQISSLKDMVERWDLKQEVVEKIEKNEEINTKEIEEIFEKIEEIENINNIDDYIPVELRITKSDYKRALSDPIFRVKILTKIDTSLILLAEKATWSTVWWLNLFSWYLTLLDKNLQLVQWNTIDVKNSLKDIDKVDKNLTFWQKIVRFMKELFVN